MVNSISTITKSIVLKKNHELNEPNYHFRGIPKININLLRTIPLIVSKQYEKIYIILMV